MNPLQLVKGPVGWVWHLGRLAKESRALRRSDLPKEMREEIARSMPLIDRRARRGKKLPNPISLLGYTVGYFREDDLRYLFNEICVQGDYLFRADHDRPVIIDCGSNIGLSVLFFKRLYPNARIIAFEPDPETFEMLEKNVAANHLRDVTLHNCALSEQDGVLTLYRPETAGSLRMSRAFERIGGKATTVASRRLPPFVTEPVDLLKMDIEGAEHAVLPDLAASGKLDLIRKIHLEYHHHIVGDVDCLAGILHFLEDHNFGYQFRTPSRWWPVAGAHSFSRWPAQAAFQDLSIYCYKK
jgi:FkbM family methyltransferase